MLAETIPADVCPDSFVSPQWRGSFPSLRSRRQQMWTNVEFGAEAANFGYRLVANGIS